MKKFHFKLDALLRVRKERENVARQDLSVARQDLQEHLEYMGKLENEGQAVEDAMRFNKNAKIDAADLAIHRQYMEVLKVRISHQQDKVMESKNVVEGKRQVVTQAMQERKVIEKLKEKQYAKWRSEVESAEKAFFDEQGTMRYFKDKR